MSRQGQGTIGLGMNKGNGNATIHGLTAIPTGGNAGNGQTNPTPTALENIRVQGLEVYIIHQGTLQA